MTRLPALSLSVAAALSLCGCGDPAEVAARPDQIEKLDKVAERFPQVRPLADGAKADGVVTEQEILGVFTEALRIKEGAADN